VIKKLVRIKFGYNKMEKVGEGQKKVGQIIISRVRTEVNTFCLSPKLSVPDLRSRLQGDCVDRVSVWGGMYMWNSPA